MNIVSWLLLLMLLGCADKLAKEGYTRIFFVSHNDQKSGATSLMELVGGLNVYGINLSSPGDGGSIHYKPGDLSLDGVWVKNGNYKFYGLASDDNYLFQNSTQMYVGQTDVIQLTGGQKIVELTIQNSSLPRKFRILLCESDGITCPVSDLPYTDAGVKIRYFVKNFTGEFLYQRGISSNCLPIYSGSGWVFPFSYNLNMVMPVFDIDPLQNGTGVPFVIEYYPGPNCLAPLAQSFVFPRGLSAELDPRVIQISPYEYDLHLPISRSGAFNLVKIENGSNLITPLKEVRISADKQMALAGSNLVFAASAVTGNELWVSNGTTAGTTLLRDISPGVASSNPTGFKTITALNKAFFWSDDGINGNELWVTDGTLGGTEIVDNINPSGDSYPGFDSQIFYFANTGKIYFYANDGVNGDELHMSTGVSGNRELVKNVNMSSNQEMLAEYNFIGSDGSNIYYNNFGPTVASMSMFYTDGTLNSGSQATSPATSNNAKNFVSDTSNSRMYFKTLAESSMGFEPHYIASGVRTLIKDIDPSDWGEFNRPVLSPSGLVYFYANDGINGEELWVTDGTSGGTVMIKDIRSGASGSSAGEEPMIWDSTNSIFYFTADDGVHGVELWKSDGTDGGTVLVKDIEAGLTGSSPKHLTLLAGKIYFWAQKNDAYNFFRSDGTEAGTVMLTDFTTSFQSGGTIPPIIYAGKLYTGMNVR